MSNYSTIAGLEAFRPSGSAAVLDFSAFTDAEEQEALDYAEELISEGCNDKFYSFADTVYADGHGRAYLFLPQDANFPYKILTTTSVQEIDFDGSVLYTYQEDVDYKAEEYYIRADDSVPVSIRNYVGGVRSFPKGSGNIKIVGTFGHTSAPLNVVKATYLLAIIYLLGEGSAGFGTSSGDSGLKQEVWKDYTVTYGSGATSESRKNKNVPNITGYLEIDRLLMRHVNLSDLMMTV